MRLSQQVRFALKNLRQAPGRSAAACLGVAVGMFVFLAAASIGWSVHYRVLARMREAMPERMIAVHRAHYDFGPLRLQPGLITKAEADRVRALPDVEAVWPQLPIVFPLRAEGEIFGVQLSTDVVVNGIDPALVASDVASGKSFAYREGQDAVAPVIASRYLLDMYNLGYAEANSLPKLSESAAIGRRFYLVLGESTLPALGNSPKSRRVGCEVVGLTSNPSVPGVVIPSQYVEQFNREFGGSATPKYNTLHIRLRTPEGLERLEKTLKEFGLEPDSKRELLLRLRFFLQTIALLALAFGGLILLLALCNVGNAFSLLLAQRRAETGLLRALGATRWTAAGLFAAEAGAIGALGGALGSAMALTAIAGANRLWQAFVPSLSIFPTGEAILSSGWPLAAIGILLPAALSALVVFPLAFREARRSPAELLR